MRDRKLDRLFDRFRRKGDASALGKVFDTTAPELMEVAVHLTRDPGEAEDLVQATFLTAIEKANDYDADRRLVPWLVGILVRHAHALRRKRARELDEDRLPPGGTTDPSDEAQASELRDSIEEALAGLPENYRSVLEPYLLRGERAVDIARASGRSPGTVRVQIRRGLVEFRRALPAGLALSAGVLVGGRSMAEVRATVLDRAARAARTLGPARATSITSTTLLGGLVMSQKLFLGALAAALLVLFGWIAGVGGDDSPETPATAPAPIPGSTGLAFAPEPQSLLEQSDDPRRVEVAAEPTETDEAAALSYEAALGGITGRVVEWSGRRVAGLRVTLLEVRPSMMIGSVNTVFESALARGLRGLGANPLIDETTTDAEGRFRLDGAHPAGFHVIGLDLGGDRPSWRLIDLSLQSGGEIDIGTIELARVRTLHGQVVDASGSGLEGVRVRAAQLPDQALPLAQIRAGATVLLKVGYEMVVVDLPGPIATLVEQLPIPLTTTDAEGRFTLEGVTENANWLIADATGYQLATRVLRGQERDIGSLPLEPLGTLSGRLVDTEGAAVVGIEVRGGRAHHFDSKRDGVAFSFASHTTDSDGHFEIAGVPGSDDHLIAWRRSPDSPWETSSGFADGDEVEVATTFSLYCTLRDHRGEVVPDAEFRLLVGRTAAELEALQATLSSAGEAERLEPGRYALRGLIEGRCRIYARAEGFATVIETVDITEDGKELELVLARRGSLPVEVLDRETEQPVAGARVSLRAERRGANLARGVSDAGGRVRLENVPLEGEEELFLRVAHPGYAVNHRKLGPGEEPVAVLLDASGGARFRLHAGGAPPTEALMVMVGVRGSSNYPDGVFPRMQLSDHRGRIELERLPAGQHRYEVYRRFLDGDPLHLVTTMSLGEQLASGNLEVHPGEVTELDIALDPELAVTETPGEGGVVEGFLRIEGQRTTGLRATLVGMTATMTAGGKAQEQQLQSDGRFRFEDLVAGEYFLTVGNTRGEFVAMRRLSVEPGQVTRLELEIRPIEFDAELLDSAGNAVIDGRLSAVPLDESSSEGGYPTTRPIGDGRWRATARAEGRFRLEGRSPTAGFGTLEVEVDPLGDPGPFELRLSRGVACAGEIHLPAGAVLTRPTNVFAPIRSLGELALNHYITLQFEHGIARFEMIGLQPGRYLLAFTESPMAKEHYRVEFELHPTGDDHLLLQLEKRAVEAPPDVIIELGADEE